MRLNKSGRSRGVIWKLIRQIAARRKRFTPYDLDLTRDQAIHNCAILKRRGELKVVRRIKTLRGGQFGIPVYTKTDQLRPASLTNKVGLVK